jgi:hypothetical protein
VPKWLFPKLTPIELPRDAPPGTPAYNAYPEQPVWNRVLQWYVDQGKTSTFLLPVGAFRCIQRFVELSQSKLLVLSGDKGYSHAEAFHSLDAPHIAVHGTILVPILAACP